MNVSLPKEFKDFVKQRVERGEYRSASAVIRASLLLLQEVVSERDKRRGEHDTRLWELKKHYLESLPDIRVEDIQRRNHPPKRRKTRAT
jgi:putative addiction module CopG family antidote